MNRFIQIFNFLGILALATLCAIQWRTNRLLNLEGMRLEKTRLEQLAQIAERDRAIKGCTADLDEFRERLNLAESQLKELEGKLNVAIKERNQLAAQVTQLTAQRDQLKANLDKWIAAVAARDAVIKQSGEQLQMSVAERNEAVQKFNELAGKYNALVKDWNSGKTGSATKPAEAR